MTLPKINGREAVPVRLIPFLTGWRMSPDVLILLFAGQHPHFHKRWAPKAWNVQGGALVSWKRRDWRRLDITELVVENAADWERKAIEFLPADAFFWRDEFEAEFYRLFGKVPFYIPLPGAPELTDEQADADLAKMVADELAKEFDPGDDFAEEVAKPSRWLEPDEEGGVIDFEPKLSAGERVAVFESFEQFMHSVPAVVLPESAATHAQVEPIPSYPEPAQGEPVPAAGGAETPLERRRRLQDRVNYWKGQGVRDYSKRAADEEEITVGRLGQMLRPKKKPEQAQKKPRAKARQPATPFSGLAPPSRRTR